VEASVTDETNKAVKTGMSLSGCRDVNGGSGESVAADQGVGSHGSLFSVDERLRSP